MTLRAVLFGLLGAAFVCGVGYYNDAVMHQTAFIGNNLPISVYGLLILFLIIINPLLFAISKKLGFSAKESAVVLVLTLAACCIPGSGLLRTFTTSLVMPYHLEKTVTTWQAPPPEQNLYWRHESVLKKLPPYMLAEVNKKNSNDVLGGFVQGKSVGNKNIKLSDVPWSAWTRTLAFWIPVILLLWIGLLGLSLVVHKQWAVHEQLPYPIATFANSLLSGTKYAVADIFRNRLFWIGMISVMLIHFNNYACQWPKLAPYLIPVPTFLNFSGLQTLFPVISNGGGWLFFQPRIYYTVIAFAFFLPTEVSLALGIGPVFWYLLVGTLAGYGIAANAGSPSMANFVQFGAYLGMLLVLIYTGRRYYYDVFRASLGFRTATPTDAVSVWGARVFLVGITLFVIYMSTMGKVDWQISVIFAASTVLIFLVMSRVVAETGAFFVQANFHPMFILLGLFGAGALGPETILLVMMFTTVLLIDPREAFMPFMVNSFKLLEMRKAPIGKVAFFAVLALFIGMAVGIPATLYSQYNKGANMADGWSTTSVPSMPFDQATQVEQRLQAQEQLAQASSLKGFEHFTHISIEPELLIALVIGLVLVLLFTLGRLRFTKWPIHPVLFLIWTTYPASWFAGSFLFGWVVKSLVMKYGGGTLYRNARPLMIGLIAGELCAGVMIMIFCWIYYQLFQLGMVTEPPKGFSIFPG